MNLHLKNVICVLFFFSFMLNVNAQEKKITGVVSDSSGPLPGVNVILKGTTTGTETDFDGKYSLNAKEGDILVFSFVGMKVTEKVVDAGSELNVLMQENANLLEEIVIVGYGSTSKKDLTGSVATIGVEQLQDKPVANVTQALQGKTSGLQIVSTGGRAGDATQISIRGNGSLSASNSALYIIDGVPHRKSSLTLAEERRLEMSFEWTRWEDLKLEGKTSYILPYPTRAVDSNPLLK
ncbi:carboxypeptidase-like regulatory domain-containing protein [Tenacibaculum mesophilum]|uniref:carboxypeptidase-like regulatory domain-containing protein n=1 Tax=Tenacibaculum mesophilum TaxID=104268 RepID=UPI0037493119